MVSTPSRASSSKSITPTNSAQHSRQSSVERSGVSTPAMTTPGGVPTAAMDNNRTPDDSSKLRTFISILKKFIGVADIAAVRFSLPAQLMEPIPNLEYWQYLDRPETFVSIGDSDDALGRMLGALRFWFTKDLKYVKGKPCKPYNSVLGEFFRCNWEVDGTLAPVLGNATVVKKHDQPITVSFLTEQTSHHPPVSAYYIDCPEKGISARGFDQLSAKFTGTSIQVAPGNFNEGIFVTLHERDEKYHLTHPTARLGGIFTGSLGVSVADTCFVTCPKTRLKAILHYLEEGWVGRSQSKMQGVIFKYDPDKDNKTRIKDVSDSDVVARLEGCWREQIFFTLGPKPFDKNPDKTMIVDLQPLWPQAKIVPPEEEQLPNESRVFWSKVTNAILSKRWGEATGAKTEIEERQRQKAAERKAQNIEWKPRFFTEAVGPAGKPELTVDGRETLDKMHKGDWTIRPSAELAA